MVAAAMLVWLCLSEASLERPERAAPPAQDVTDLPLGQLGTAASWDQLCDGEAEEHGGKGNGRPNPCSAPVESVWRGGLCGSAGAPKDTVLTMGVIANGSCDGRVERAVLPGCARLTGAVLSGRMLGDERNGLRALVIANRSGDGGVERAIVPRVP